MIDDVSPDRWTRRYEELRGAALEGTRPVAGPWGLGLLVRQGLVAWMRAWPQSRQETHVAPAVCSAPAPAMPASVSGPLVDVLTNMIFTTRQEALA